MTVLSKTNKLLLIAVRKGYRVTKKGLAIGPSGRCLSRMGSDGYMEFWIKGGDVGNGNVRVHRLQAYQNFGDRLFEDGIEARHLDGNELNNSEDNIDIGTHRENVMDRTADARLQHARRAARKLRALTDEQVQRLRLENKNGISYRALGERYGISKSTVHYIVIGRTYSGMAQSGSASVS